MFELKNIKILIAIILVLIVLYVIYRYYNSNIHKIKKSKNDSDDSDDSDTEKSDTLDIQDMYNDLNNDFINGLNPNDFIKRYPNLDPFTYIELIQLYMKPDKVTVNDYKLALSDFISSEK